MGLDTVFRGADVRISASVAIVLSPDVIEEYAVDS
jgi:hypothetical protein